MAGILEKLKWESLKKEEESQQTQNVYRGEKGAASKPVNDRLKYFQKLLGSYRI